MKYLTSSAPGARLYLYPDSRSWRPAERGAAAPGQPDAVGLRRAARLRET
ncbi:hypothetical protein [Roseateles sp. P5_E4]